MPKVSWSRESMKYSMCFFPLIGAFIGVLSVLLYKLMIFLSFPGSIRAAVLLAVPLLVTGGIHMDGFLDTIDAIKSFRTREERLQILKDPHCGAFAVIFGVFYLVLEYAFLQAADADTIKIIAASYALSRILSGISVVRFPKAKKDGTLRSFADAADRRVYRILLMELIVMLLVLLYMDPLLGAAAMVSAMLVFLYYWFMSQQSFGGTTGDLAGYFLSLCELWMLILVTIVSLLRGVLLTFLQ